AMVSRISDRAPNTRRSYANRVSLASLTEMAISGNDGRNGGAGILFASWPAALGKIAAVLPARDDWMLLAPWLNRATHRIIHEIEGTTKSVKPSVAYRITQDAKRTVHQTERMARSARPKVAYTITQDIVRASRKLTSVCTCDPIAHQA